MEKSNEESVPKPKSDEVVNTGADMAGSAIGAAIGLIAAGPGGAILGGAAGPVASLTLRKVAAEIRRRLLSPHEEERIATVLTYAIDKIRQNESKGQHLRQDGFFESNLDDRSTAEEVIEGTLYTAQREYEEKKLKFQGNLLANICFNTKVDRSLANMLLKLSERISYRQILLLSFFNRLDELGVPWETSSSKLLRIKNPDELGELRFIASRSDLDQEIKDLQQQGLLDDLGIGMATLARSRGIRLSDLGKLVFELMELGEVDRQKLEYFVEAAAMS